MLATTLSDKVLLFPYPVPLPNIVIKLFWHWRFHRDPGNQWLWGICAHQAGLSMMQILKDEIPGYQSTLID